uniref:NADH-ubiquinone oxidoreductase chain 3 n=1 Tax=Codonobdella sp. IK-2021 TaxID=2848640 RepID=A0A8F2E637_9ANNE|nr:NADH dehydrogenase subunit 3 [Codonobdella sp. B45A]QWT29625.1 NADH dehydrogenase subunit 3 [Codonobdella sp. IK-2021]UTS56334.1 NADH dehydrogenase subunit 3 [Codonobdella sp. B45A]
MYVSLTIFLMSMLVPVVVYVMSTLLYMKSNSDRMKMSPFECGFDTMNSSRTPFSTRFFLLAVLFIVFDIEIVLITPFPILLMVSLNYQMMMSFMFIMLILLLGLIHEWSEGSLNWYS